MSQRHLTKLREQKKSCLRSSVSLQERVFLGNFLSLFGGPWTGFRSLHFVELSSHSAVPNEILPALLSLVPTAKPILHTSIWSIWSLLLSYERERNTVWIDQFSIRNEGFAIEGQTSLFIYCGICQNHISNPKNHKSRDALKTQATAQLPTEL